MLGTHSAHRDKANKRGSLSYRPLVWMRSGQNAYPSDSLAVDDNDVCSHVSSPLQWDASHRTGRLHSVPSSSNLSIYLFGSLYLDKSYVRSKLVGCAQSPLRTPSVPRGTLTFRRRRARHRHDTSSQNPRHPSKPIPIRSRSCPGPVAFAVPRRLYKTTFPGYSGAKSDDSSSGV